MSDEVLRSMQMTAGNQAVGRAIAEGRISADSLDAPVVGGEREERRPVQEDPGDADQPA